MGKAEDLSRVISSLQSQYDAKKAQNRQIKANIEALENSKRLMVDALHKTESMRNSVGKQKVDSWWSGTLANSTTEHINTSRNQANSIAQGIKDGIGQIDGYIWKLRTEYDYIVGLLNGLEDAISAKNRERQKAISEANSSSSGGR